MKGKIINFRVIFYPFIAFLLGIIVARRFYGGSIEVIIVSLLALSGVTAYLIYRKSYKPLIYILCFFLIGNGFYFIGNSSFNVKDYQGKVAVVGRISDDINDYGYNTEIVLDNVKINGDKAKNIRLIVENCVNDISIGKYVTFEAEIEKSKPFYLLEFNSKDYRANVGYNATVEFDNLVFSEGYKKVDETIRLKIKNLIYSNMSEENAGIAYAVMFGDKSDLDGEIYTSYQKSGIIHVLTVSGLHVGFLVALFYKLLKKCRVNNIINLVITTIVLVFYAYLCNFSPSVVRAGIMAICMMSARSLHRKYDSLNALGISGFILCVFQPLTALDVGFLMSFFCVFAIVMLNPSITKFLEAFIPSKVANLISLSTSAQLGILPFIAGTGGSINLLSFVVNIIVVPIFGVLYPYLFIVSMLGTFIPFGVLLKAVNFVLTIINKIAIFFGSAGLEIKLSSMGFALTLIFFIILFVLGRFFMLSFHKKFAMFTACFFSLVLVIGMYAIPLKTKTSISYLNSYGEMSVVLTTRSGQRAVIGENSLLRKYKTKYDIPKLGVYFSYNTLSDEDVTELNELGLNKFICSTTASESGGGNCEVVELNQGYSVAGISFSYLATPEETLGIIFDIDNHRIFVANKINLSYNLNEIISFYQPEIVFAGNNNNLAQGSYTCITYNEVDGCDYSYEKEGNFALTLKNNKWIKRSLD